MIHARSAMTDKADGVEAKGREKCGRSGGEGGGGRSANSQGDRKRRAKVSLLLLGRGGRDVDGLGGRRLP